MSEGPRVNIPRVPEPLQQLADPGEVFQNPRHVEWLQTFLKMLRTFLAGVVVREQATPYVIMSSPSGRAFRVSVTDEGEITAVPIRG